jgi:DNA-binding response OmpR family regulator
VARILLIEPDIVLARTFEVALKHAGHDVRLSPGAQDAVQLADESRPDLVLLELQLVAHSGVEFLHEFRSYTDWQSVPVIILSKVPTHEFKMSMDSLKNRLGVRAYLYKPATTLQKLITTINETLVSA